MHYHYISDIDHLFDDNFSNALRVSSLDNFLITPCIIQNAINKLTFLKACGNDGLSAEYFMHFDRCITILLSIFYKSYFSSDDFMNTIIIPSVHISCSMLYLLYNYCVMFLL